MTTPFSFCQTSFTDERALPFDLFVAASGYEARASHVARHLREPPAARLVLTFAEHVHAPTRVANDRVFSRLGYTAVACSGDDHAPASGALLALLPPAPDRGVRIGIDLSSMTRAWYWGLLKQLARHQLPVALDVCFFYSVAEFIRPPAQQAPAQVVGPIAGLSSGPQMPDRPIALLIGLGYEVDMALGLVEYVEPRRTWLFYADPATDPRFVRQVRRANQILLEQVDPENIIKYRFNDFEFTLGSLDSLIGGLVRDSRVVIAPMGPKPFGLLAFALSLRYPEVDVWRVSSGSAGGTQVRKPTGDVLTARFTFPPYVPGGLNPDAA